MKNRILFISLAVVLALSVGLIGCGGGGGGGGPTAPTSIKVGLARDLDGPLSVFQCGYGALAYRWFAAHVNEDVGHAGKLHLSDYDTATSEAWVPIELDIKDFDVATWDIAAVTEDLIVTDKCDVIWGGPGTDCIFTQSSVCNEYKKVVVFFEGGASSMIWDHDIDHWPYVWCTLSFANWHQLPVLHDILQAKLGREPKVYMTYIGGAGSTHGIEYRTEAMNVFGDNFIDGGFHDYWMPTSGTAPAVVEAAKVALGDPAHPNYDMCIFETYPWNVAMLTVALLGSDFNPPAILFGPGDNSADYPFNFGATNVEGICGYVVAVPETSAAIAKMCTDLGAQAEKDWADPTTGCHPGVLTKGTQLIDYWGDPCYIPGLQMWAKAVENAGNLDGIAVRNEMAKFSSTNPCQTVLGNTWFTVFGSGGSGGGILAYECHPGEVGQWQNGVYKIIGGNDPTGALEFPMTDKWAWLS
jgi:hypothetical protein